MIRRLAGLPRTGIPKAQIVAPAPIDRYFSQLQRFFAAHGVLIQRDPAYFIPTVKPLRSIVMASELESKVKAIIVDKLGVDESEITSEASFTTDLGADSLDTVELIMEFENQFDVSIPDEDAEKIATVGDAVSYLTSKTEG